VSVSSPSPVLVLPAILGEVVVWGDDANNQITDRPRVAGFSKVAQGGATQGLVLGAAGVPVLWGGAGLGTPSMPIVPALTLTAGEKYEDIPIGVSFAAAIRRSDAWIETSGRFANTPHEDAAEQLKKFKGTRFIAVTVGGGHGVGIVEQDGTLLQWGAGEGTEPRPKDVKFPKPQYIKFVQVRARSDYNLALDEHGNLYAWGGDHLFRPDSLSPSHPLAGTKWRFVSTQPSGSGAGHIPVHLVPKGYWYHKGPFEAIAAGAIPKTPANPLPHVLALRPDGSVIGWPTSAAAAVAPADVTFSAIAAGRGFSIGLDRTGELHHWGEPGAIAANGKGVLENVPKGPFVSIGAGTRHATAVRTGGMSASSVDR
jgi:alpha-tubulin suppressor-like RCC1 family protein